MDKKLNKLLYILLFSGLGILSYFFLVNYATLPIDRTGFLSSIYAILFFVVTFNILGFSTIKLSSWIHSQYPTYLQKRWRIIVTYTTVSLLLLLLNYGMLVAAKYLVGAENPFRFPSGGRILLLIWLIELVIMGLLVTNKFMQETIFLQRQASKLEEENNKAHYAALQSQLNPHFLFNSLNTLIAEIEYDTKSAIRFTRNLSNVYRYVLQCQEKPLITLREELEFMRAYLFLHQVRLGDCIICSTTMKEDEMDQLLPPLTLQLLIENILKHNSITQQKPMEIEIAVKDDFLVVSNSVNRKKSNDSAGIGLKNLSNRCRLICGKEIEISDFEERFTVKIPLIYE